MKSPKYILALLAGLTLTGCALDEQNIPFEEYYLRNYIKRFGLIDPTQDWNLAQRSKVDLRLHKDVKKVVVYANVFGSYFRVARSLDLEAGVSRIPIDIPVNTEELAVDIDGEVYFIGPDQSIDTVVDKPMAPSRATTQPYLDEDSVLAWLIVAEDLGSTDDVDFNDFIARMSYTETSYFFYGDLAPEDWYVFEQDPGDEIHFGDDKFAKPAFIPARAEARVDGTTRITIQAAASGGIKKIYLHYRQTATSTDYLIGPNGAIVCPDSEAAASGYEWHYWFDGTNYNIITNTRPQLAPIAGASCEVEIPGDFTFTTYSQMTYESTNPMEIYNFNFDKRQIQGFYITVDSHKVDINSPESPDSGNTPSAYDLGKAIGHNRNAGLPPQMFLIPDICSVDAGTNVVQHFQWPIERKLIDDAYPDFGDWVTDGTVGWNDNGVEVNVVPQSFVKGCYGER